MKKFVIETDNKKTEFSVTESFKITGNENMVNKISVIKPGPLKTIVKEKEYTNTQGISALVTIEDSFTWVHIFFNNDNENIPMIQKKLAINSRIAELAKKIIFSKLIYDDNKKG